VDTSRGTLFCLIMARRTPRSDNGGMHVCLGLTVGVFSLLSAFTSCSLCQPPRCPELPPPENPGDKCRNFLEEGPTTSCPDGMECKGVTKRGFDRPAARCHLLPGRCAASADCKVDEFCIRNSLAIGYCAPSPQVVSPPRGQ
jgi:hypothetical protein